MNFLLTGELHSGKSTVIKKTLCELNMRVGGFCTPFGSNRESPDRLLCMHRADLPPEIDMDHAIAVFSAGDRQSLPERFDELGCRFLLEAEGLAEIIIMDELGALEKDAEKFQKAVLKTLDMPGPVLGVLRKGFSDWTKNIAEREDVCVITVTADNRDELPMILSDLILKSINVC